MEQRTFYPGIGTISKHSKMLYGMSVGMKDINRTYNLDVNHMYA